MDQSLDLNVYLNMAKRWKKQMLVPAASIFICSLLLAMLLPSIYRASATILIENQNISKEVVQTTVSGYVEQRLQQLTQVVLGRVNLMNLVNKLDLFSGDKDKLTDEEMVERLRKNIKLEPVQADVGPTVPGRAMPSATTTIAFEITFDDRDPKKAAAVTSELASLFLEANLKNREETATSAVDFLNKQLDDLKKEIEVQEEKLSVFKAEHVNELPELQQLNLATADKLERDRSSLEEQLRSLYTRKTYLEGQLATIDPYSGAIGPDGTRYLSPKEEHERLRRTYMTLRSSLSEQHPDVVKVKRQLQAMGQEIGGPEDVKVYAQALREKQEQLAKLSETVTEKHPDVVALKREIKDLNRSMERAQAGTPKRALDEPTNPAFIALKAQVTSTQLEIRGVQAQLARLNDMQMDFQKRLQGAPRVEKEYQEMLRDYDTARNKYRELSARLMAAKESKGLEESQIGDKFTLIAPPLVPEKPVKPKRLLIVLLGFFVAAGVGVGTGLLLEAMDHSIRSADALAHITGTPILAVIPFVAPPVAESPQVALKWRPSKRMMIIGAVLLFFLAVHLIYDPLDVIVISLVRKLTTIF